GPSWLRPGWRRRRRSSWCTPTRWCTTTCPRWTTTTSAAASPPCTSRSARRWRSSPATACSPRRSRRWRISGPTPARRSGWAGGAPSPHHAADAPVRVVARGTLGYAVGFGGDRLVTVELGERFALEIRDGGAGTPRAIDLGPAEGDWPALACDGDRAWVGGDG